MDSLAKYVESGRSNADQLRRLVLRWERANELAVRAMELALRQEDGDENVDLE